MKKFKRTLAVFLSCMMTLSTCMVSFAEEPEEIEESTIVDVSEVTEAEEEALFEDISLLSTDTDAEEEIETLEIGADASALFDVPYISTYYFNPKPLTTDNIQIPLYLTDCEQSEYLKNDTSKKLDLIYEVDGVSKTIKDIPLGDYTLTLGKLSAGMHTFSVQVQDKTTGLKSHKLYNDLWVVTSYDIPSSKVYKMTTSDLTNYKIKNNNSTNATDMVNTRTGLTKLFADKQAAGYEKIVLLAGTYRIEGEDATAQRNNSIFIPSHFTVDMNGSTFKLNTITSDINAGKDAPGASGCIVKMNDVVDAHLINGTLEGDRMERKALGLESNGKGEPINTIVINGGKYCSIENLTIKNTTGHTVFTQGNWGPNLVIYSYTNVAIVDGKEIANDNYRTSCMVDLTKIIDYETDEDYMYVGHPEGYRGIKGDSAFIYVSFYDSNQKFMQTVTGMQYRKMQIPAGAKYARVSLLGTGVSTTKYDGNTLSIFVKRYGEYNAFKNLDFIDTRTTAMSPSTCSNLLIEGCTYTRVGSSITPSAVDFEDGWEECQDVYYMNNKQLEKATGNTGTVIDNTGYNHVYKNCTNHDIAIRYRVIGATLTDMNDKDTVICYQIGTKKRGKFGRIYNNDCGNIWVQYKASENNNIEPVEFKIKDCTISSVEGNTNSYTNGVYDKVVYENCIFTCFGGGNAKFVGCTIQLTGNAIWDNLYFYDCTFLGMDTGKVNLSGASYKNRVFEKCTFKGKTPLTNYNLVEGTFKNCEFEDLRMIAATKDTGETILFEDCSINSSADSFVDIGPFGYSDPAPINLIFRNCTISHTGKNLIHVTSKTTKGSQILFDNCTINKTSGNLIIVGYDSFGLGDLASSVGLNVTLKDTPINSGVTVDGSKVNPAVIKITYSETSKKNGILTENGKIYYYIDDVKQTGWQTVGGKKYYFGTDYAAKTGIQTISSKVYYFDTNGVMQTGLKTVSSKVYYFGSDGIAKTGWQTVSNNKYYFGTDGVAKTGLQTIDSKKYYFKTSGVMQTGWQTISSKKYYLGTDGVMVTGTVVIDGKTYEFDANGVFIKEVVEEVPEQPEKKNGFIEESGKTYYYVDDAKQLGWKQIEGSWYYFGAEGSMATKKWVAYGGDWYYFGDDGKMSTNKWVAYGGEWYYFGASGVMATDKWIAYGGDWYYFDAAGIMVTNKWVAYKGSWYYFGTNGTMTTSKWVSYKGDWYFVGDDGVMATSKWIQYKNDWYYFNASGIMVTGKQTINGKIYNFNSSGVWISN